jgi:hypothetical protein
VCVCLCCYYHYHVPQVSPSSIHHLIPLIFTTLSISGYMPYTLISFHFFFVRWACQLLM